MKKAKAIAITQDEARNHPLSAALHSAQNLSAVILDFMYGTKERTRFTFLFAVSLVAYGILLDKAAHAATVCPV